MGLESIVNVVISRNTRSVSIAGFGIPLVLGSSDKMSGDVVRAYASILAVAEDFAITDPEYLEALALFSQEKKPKEIRIGYRATGQAIATALGLIEAVDNDWYCLILCSRVKADILAAAAYIEAQRKMCITQTSDADVLTTATDDVASTLKANNYMRTAVIYSGVTAECKAAAWCGRVLPDAPGSESWKFKTLIGVTADNLSLTQESHAKLKNAATFQMVGGVDITAEGKTAGGEFIDVVRFIDWLQARTQERVYSLLISVEKVPYTDGGIASIESLVRAQLREGERVGGLVPGSSQVFVPELKNIDPADKRSRTLNGVEFTSQLAGAIHAVEINGYVSV